MQRSFWSMLWVTLEELEAMCVKGEETWEERKQKREDEINALKEALALLEDA